MNSQIKKRKHFQVDRRRHVETHHPGTMLLNKTASTIGEEKSANDTGTCANSVATVTNNTKRSHAKRMTKCETKSKQRLTNGEDSSFMKNQAKNVLPQNDNSQNFFCELNFLLFFHFPVPINDNEQQQFLAIPSNDVTFTNDVNREEAIGDREESATNILQRFGLAQLFAALSSATTASGTTTLNGTMQSMNAENDGDDARNGKKVKNNIENF